MAAEPERLPVGQQEWLLGPHSVTWQLHADPTMWLAGVSSLFLQSLHPRAAAGVLQNSTFQTDPMGRLLRTADFVGTATYRPLPEVRRAAAKVRGIHRRLRGTDPVSGAEFRVDDPELLLWVHCAEVWSFLTVVGRAGFPISTRQADRYLDEQRRVAELVGLPADDVPGSIAAMRAYFAAIRPSLARTEASEIFYRFLLDPPVALPVRLGYRPIGMLAYSLQPRWAVALHGHPALPRAAADVGATGFRRAALLVPRLVRYRFPTGHLWHAIDVLGSAAVPSVAALRRL